MRAVFFEEQVSMFWIAYVFISKLCSLMVFFLYLTIILQLFFCVFFQMTCDVWLISLFKDFVLLFWCVAHCFHGAQIIMSFNINQILEQSPCVQNIDTSVDYWISAHLCWFFHIIDLDFMIFCCFYKHIIACYFLTFAAIHITKS